MGKSQVPMTGACVHKKKTTIPADDNRFGKKETMENSGKVKFYQGED